MNRKYARGFWFWIILFQIVSNPLEADSGDQVRVKVRSADVLLKPSFDATVIARAGRGQVFDVMFRIGPWVKVNLMSDPDGNSIAGYIGQHHIEAIPKPQTGAPEPFRVRIIVRVADILFDPSPDSFLIDRMSHGQELEAQAGFGSWYRVMLPPDSAGIRKLGFIREHLVQEIMPERRTPGIPDKTEVRPEATMKWTKLYSYSLIIKAGLGCADFGDINKDLESRVRKSADQLSAPYSGSVRPLRSGTVFSGEYRFPVGGQFDISLGLGYMDFRETSRVSYIAGSDKERWESDPKVTAFPFEFNGVFYPVPHVFFRGGLGVYYVRHGFSHRKTLGSEWTETFGTATGHAMGVQGSLGVMIPLTSRLDMVIEGMGRHARTKKPAGSQMISSSDGRTIYEKGDLYYQKMSDQGKNNGLVFISKDKPSIGSGIRKAQVDLSGFSIAAGLKYNF